VLKGVWHLVRNGGAANGAGVKKGKVFGVFGIWCETVALRMARV